jgi:hypothetical protein
MTLLNEALRRRAEELAPIGGVLTGPELTCHQAAAHPLDGGTRARRTGTLTFPMTKPLPSRDCSARRSTMIVIRCRPASACSKHSRQDPTAAGARNTAAAKGLRAATSKAETAPQVEVFALTARDTEAETPEADGD